MSFSATHYVAEFFLRFSHKSLSPLFDNAPICATEFVVREITTIY